MPDISRAFIVTDPTMVKLGYVDRVLYYLRKRQQYVHSEIFADVEPDPSIDTIRRGTELMNKFNPDVIIALGGGSAMDAAKAMWLYYEYPDTDFTSLRLKFMDIQRKRAFKFPRLGQKARDGGNTHHVGNRFRGNLLCGYNRQEKQYKVSVG